MQKLNSIRIPFCIFAVVGGDAYSYIKFVCSKKQKEDEETDE